MTPEEEQCRDVYAYYGLAAYLAQCLEKSLTSFLLLHARTTNTKLTLKELDDLEEVLHKKTLGQLLKEVGVVVTHDLPSEQLVESALKKRNFLIHHYFWTYASESLSSKGRAQMLTELEDYCNLFQRADVLATALCKAAAQAAGIPWSFFDAEFDRMLKEAQDQDGSVDQAAKADQPPE